ncbi:ArgP/LysG family DNA-binding transcriptional regulator [Nocardioides sp. ChNu-153]|uniref:ArgP/LysG family DNA-binding transcriptional regulator n=1 Tax=Nocardioides sp. ChNu-153 TaxID=2779364 RepID=UPI002650600D|nr:ArgP/LysG family DNA-binding transcriptional regulator [Nocardioides sp. ChNu-153]MDN7120998.1 ArgP/LysG family DNA-binding transcriptional regulator [Nocardioides sp. ChNu-153]
MFAPAQLAALVAVVDHGTFEAAARALHVTPSAVSQRVRALEAQVGQVVVSRAAPCRATASGEVLVALGRQTDLLAAEASRRLGGDAAPRTVAVAVNADSLATWFHDVLEAVAGWAGVALEVHVEDQAHSARLLREGRVLAAVTSDGQPVQGCSVRPIGALRYHPVVDADLLARVGGPDAVDWRRLPLVRFNELDTLQHEQLERLGVPPPDVVHRVPTTADMAEAVRRGLGWGMFLDGQLDEPGTGARPGRRVVPLPGGETSSVPLFWQRWRVRSEVLDRLTDAVVAAAPGG